MFIIENDFLTVGVNPFGAELWSVVSKKSGKEYIWQGNPEIWNGRAPVLFPICGRLSGDSYEYGGKRYSLPKHGFARRNQFEITLYDSNSATLALRSNNKFKNVYPFDFELYVRFVLDGRTLKTIYTVVNSDSDKMYFSIGAHPAYNVEIGGSVVFSEKGRIETLLTNSAGLVISDKRKLLAECDDTLVLDGHNFDDDALIFEAPKSESVEVKDPDGKTAVKMTYGKVPYLLLWSKPGAPYVCVEPWHGIPDFDDGDRPFEEKRAIVAVESGKEFEFVTTAEFFD